ncbi:MAG: CoA transferase [Acidobacteria bacterium]|nr:CoA transferase [Acidobacteriota bacterium]
MSGPLDHLRVLDLTRLLPGGYCTLLLSDLGADVLKVEEPGKGDYIRWMPPFAGEVSAGHAAMNRGKRSMTLNLKHPRGPEVLRRLARRADVLVESFRPGVLDRLGAGFESVRHPRLVWCAITGYGQDGPYRERAGHDINYIGFGGALGVTGEAGGPPVVPGVQIGDIGGGGLMAAVGILAALAERERTGRGRFVDISMLDGVVSWLSFQAAALGVSGQVPARGEMHLSGRLACYRVYRCGDGKHLTVGALEPQFWSALCKALGTPELAERQFAVDEQDATAARVQEVLATRSRDEWVRELGDLDACVGPVNDLAETLEDPQVRARRMVVEVPTPSGLLRTTGNPIKIRGEPGRRPAAPPGFGEHTDAALLEAGCSPAEIAELHAAGAV